MAAKVTIKTIAGDLGISHMTVSRALSGHPNVSAETRRLVSDHARALGYVKSAAATAMRGEGSRIIGLLLPNLSNAFYARFANDFAALCSERGIDPVIHLTDDSEVKEQAALRRLRALQVRAVVTVPSPRDDTLNDRVPLDGMQVIQMIRHRDEPVETASLDLDDAAAIRQAVAHLARRGCRRIAYIGAPHGFSSGRSRLGAYVAGMQQAGLAPSDALIRTARPSFRMGAASVASLLEDAGPDALVCGGFEISDGALDVVLTRGIAMPTELAFVGYGDPSFYRYISGGVTTIALPVADLTADAVALADSILAGEPARPMPPRAATLTLRGTA
ncbi:LacI family DNA-binding transcriptional regulator [Oceaniglobus trochenteri]|uniref:LacI family DNA-binding transcriptional regulator n=1 Tax=Oceaniglobus trochenteri TaxID=2763260 RepID=UPI001CFF8DCC|nr:LacI family DNA-binding transcriptional regulator [Oceaniglobus trochenteri]